VQLSSCKVWIIFNIYKPKLNSLDNFIVTPLSTFIRNLSVVSEIKHTDGWKKDKDMTSSLCILSNLCKEHKKCMYDKISHYKTCSLWCISNEIQITDSTFYLLALATIDLYHYILTALHRHLHAHCFLIFWNSCPHCVQYV
jgi:hypothetical protein